MVLHIHGIINHLIVPHVGIMGQVMPQYTYRSQHRLIDVVQPHRRQAQSGKHIICKPGAAKQIAAENRALYLSTPKDRATIAGKRLPCDLVGPEWRRPRLNVGESTLYSAGGRLRGWHHHILSSGCIAGPNAMSSIPVN